MLLLYLTSALFLGWSLGANDAANVFGTAVATRMVKFGTAALISGIFVVLGAVVSGAGASATLGELGAVNALGGSFMVALAAGLTVLWMTRAGLPVSVTQAIVGGIVGWNLFTGSQTDAGSLATIVSTWVACPILAAALAGLMFVGLRWFLARREVHILERDSLTRIGLLLVGAFGAYALGANNIANVVGVFVPAVPAGSVRLLGAVSFSHAQILFLIGGLAIAAGVYTYSKRVMMTVGKDLFRLTPVAGLIVVAAHSIVLFLFASEGLRDWLVSRRLPAIPLVPVSSSQAVIGAIVGIAIAKGGRNIKLGVLGRVAGGWVATPVAAGLLSFFGLFFLQNVFTLTVQQPIPYEITKPARARLVAQGASEEALSPLVGQRFANARAFKAAVRRAEGLGDADVRLFLDAAEIRRYVIDPAKIPRLDLDLLTPGQVAAIRSLTWRTYTHRWQLRDALVAASDHWAFLPDTRRNYAHNKNLETKLRYVQAAFRVYEIGPGQ
ncbi:MAG: inorganic phosphate transporter [Candidatus Eisenbacteria bacterium]|nr:inorganic phosphate transporter [Candidatus Eisenbacteria bacterium]